MKKDRKAINVRSVFVLIFIAVVVAAVIGGIFLLDSPAQERLRRLDERRVADLREIAYALDVYWAREDRLPSSLEELSNEERIVRELGDPETGEPYEYRVLSETTYELCATFASGTEADDRDPLYRDLWLHDPGRQCFEVEAQDPERPLER